MTTIAYSSFERLSLSRRADLRDSILVLDFEESPVPERHATCITFVKGNVSCSGDTSTDYKEKISHS
jgi:hypothetical protein